MFVQAALGGVVVEGELEATLVTLHFATAMTLLAVLVNITANSFCYVKLPTKGPSIARLGPEVRPAHAVDGRRPRSPC